MVVCLRGAMLKGRCMSGECRKIGDRQRWRHLPPGPHHTYNAADHPTTLRYPGGTAGQQGELVTYGYNGLGQLNSVSGSGVSYVSSTTYNATSTGAQCDAAVS